MGQRKGKDANNSNYNLDSITKSTLINNFNKFETSHELDVKIRELLK